MAPCSRKKAIKSLSPLKIAGFVERGGKNYSVCKGFYLKNRARSLLIVYVESPRDCSCLGTGLIAWTNRYVKIIESEV